MAERIQTLHPQAGKKGVNIDLAKYERIRDYLLQHIKKEGEITYQELNNRAVTALSPTFKGKVGWYVVTVKLDLEARGIIERVPKTSPHRVRLCSGTAG